MLGSREGLTRMTWNHSSHSLNQAKLRIIRRTLVFASITVINV